MTPSERAMPVIEVIGPRSDGSFVVKLPGGVYRVTRTAKGAVALVHREAPGSSIRWVPAPKLRPEQAHHLIPTVPPAVSQVATPASEVASDTGP